MVHAGSCVKHEKTAGCQRKTALRAENVKHFTKYRLGMYWYVYIVNSSKAVFLIASIKFHSSEIEGLSLITVKIVKASERYR